MLCPTTSRSCLLLVLLAAACSSTAAADLVERITAARAAGTPVTLPLTAPHQLGSADAYALQWAVNLRLGKTLGPRTGFKAGYCSTASQQAWGVDEPAYGEFLQGQAVTDGGVIRAADFNAFHIETEVAFVLGRSIEEPLQGREQLLPCVASVHVGLDIPDNRFAGAETKPVFADILATGVGAHRYALGPAVDPSSIDLDVLSVSLTRNGTEVYRGPSSAVLDSPWNVLAWLAAKRLEQGLPLQAGEVILTGAVAAAYTGAGAEALGTYIGAADGLGEVRVRVE